MFVEKLKKDKFFLAGFIALALAAILGIALGGATLGASKTETHQGVSNTTVFLDFFKNDYLSNTPDWYSTHVKTALALGIMALLVGVISLALAIVVLVKPEAMASKKILIMGIVMLVLAIILGAIAVQFANDVMNSAWINEQLKAHAHTTTH
ncbi:hypothetical protein MYMA111404_03075 [Mycoplasma marinum]|uniref:Uncharacterized protein n=1 Tax=Mycoplasma marinum TaxID=1937190 RepID=A0A4R0XKJ3_9MOLU|nr:hypothetical protein [Mycoplasma marinum]TCG11176.1 hypothetical protein C4B24_02740 [Mycoplasma marinum]